MAKLTKTLEADLNDKLLLFMSRKTLQLRERCHELFIIFSVSFSSGSRFSVLCTELYWFFLLLKQTFSLSFSITFIFLLFSKSFFCVPRFSSDFLFIYFFFLFFRKREKRNVDPNWMISLSIFSSIFEYFRFSFVPWFIIVENSIRLWINFIDTFKIHLARIERKKYRAAENFHFYFLIKRKLKHQMLTYIFCSVENKLWFMSWIPYVFCSIWLSLYIYFAFKS